MDPHAITADGLEALRAELEELETSGRERMAEQIKTARGWGDLKENAEYHAAKEAQAHLETKIARLRDRLRRANVVEAGGSDVVGFGSHVQLTDEATGRQVEYTLVSQGEASASEGKLSANSPVA